MSRIITPAEQLDAACSQLIGEFSVKPVDLLGEREASVGGLALSMDMSRLAIYYTAQEELENVAAHRRLQAEGNPSARIHTYTATGEMALYNFDRGTGLVVVNNFGFPENEVRALGADDREALGSSPAGKRMLGIANLGRALTDTGIGRLIGDLNAVTRRA